MITGKFEGKNFHGSGCLIASKIVLTCAHNVYHRPTQKEPTNLMFSPAVNGKIGRSFKVKKAFYPEEYKSVKLNESEFDFAVLELEHDIKEGYGYIGIDMRDGNTEENEEIDEVTY